MDGAISQTIFLENSTALVLSLVSIYIQVMAKIETKGMAASSAPAKELRFDISEISTIKIVVIKSLKR